MVDKIFNTVAETLDKSAKKIGVTYNEINVVGMFAWMGVTAGLVGKVLLDKKKLDKLKKKKRQ